MNLSNDKHDRSTRVNIQNYLLTSACTLYVTICDAKRKSSHCTTPLNKSLSNNLTKIYSDITEFRAKKTKYKILSNALC